MLGYVAVAIRAFGVFALARAIYWLLRLYMAYVFFGVQRDIEMKGVAINPGGNPIPIYPPVRPDELAPLTSSAAYAVFWLILGCVTIFACVRLARILVKGIPES